MNGRTLLNVPLVAALVASAFAVTSTASARPQGEPAPATPAAPATGTPATPATPPTTKPGDPPATPAAEDETKKKPPQPGDTQAAPGADPGAAPAPAAGGPADGSISVGLGGEAGPRKDEIKVDTKKSDDDFANRNRFAGSVFFWDHSLSTQTARLETNAQQSYTPSYEWWFSLQPRYAFTKRLQYRLRADLFKEMTNAGDTTYYRENALGDVWNTLRYEMPISERLKHTKLAFSATIKLPLSKGSQAQGVFFKPSAGVAISQKIPINGESARFFPGANLALSGSYEKPIVNSTTADNYGSFDRVRQDSDGRSFLSDQLSGGMLTAHTVLASVRGDLSITEKWNLGVSMIWINNWLYAPTGSQQVRTDTGMVDVPRDNDATRFTQSTWLIASTDYEIIDEMSVGVGYYNLASVIGSNGQRRGVAGADNVWWSPSARVFGTVTAHLDKIYDKAAGIKREEPKKAAALAPPKQIGSSQ